MQSKASKRICNMLYTYNAEGNAIESCVILERGSG
jgi:hypothetical protein